MKVHLRHERLFFWSILFIAVFLRLLSWSGRIAIQTDSAHFIVAGIHLLRGEGLTDSRGALMTVHPLLYSILTGLVWKVIGDGEFAARLISFLAGVVVVLQIRWFAMYLWGTSVGLAAMGLAAVYPSLVNSSTAALAESLTMAFTLAFLFYLAKVIETWRPGNAVLAGLFAALAGWTRSTATLRGWVGILVLLAFLLPKSNLRQKKVWMSAILFTGSLLVLLQPLMGFYYKHTGKWTINPESSVWLQIELDWTDPAAYEDALEYSSDPDNQPQSSVQVFLKSPARWIERYLQNAYTFYKRTLPKELMPFFLFLSGIGFLVPPVHGYRSLACLLPLFVPAFIWVLMRGTEPRDVIPIVPGILLLAAAGIVRFWQWGRETDEGERGWIWGRTFAGVIIGLAVLLCLPGALKYRLGTHGQAVEHKLMGQWIRENVPKEERHLLTRKPMVAFYANARAIGMTRGDLEEFRKWARDHDARFLCVDDRSTAPVYPALAPLLEEGFEPPSWLKFRHRVETPDGCAMVLYEITDR